PVSDRACSRAHNRLCRHGPVQPSPRSSLHKDALSGIVRELIVPVNYTHVDFGSDSGSGSSGFPAPVPARLVPCVKYTFGTHGHAGDQTTMTAIHETAYPRLRSNLTEKELRELYTPTLEEMVFVQRVTSSPVTALGVAVLLKTFQRLGYFPAFE